MFDKNRNFFTNRKILFTTLYKILPIQKKGVENFYPGAFDYSKKT